MSSTKHHPFHIVDLSPWPILTAFALFFLTLGSVMFLHERSGGEYVALFGLFSIISSIYLWWRDVINEGIVGHHHTDRVRMGLRIGMALFILSEIVLFCSLFFSYFSASLFPVGILEGFWVVEQGVWPPKNIHPFDPWDIPFVNTLILLLSGATVTWAHHEIEQRKQQNSVTALAITILLGTTFTCLQAYEYYHAGFSITDGIYGANFYLVTGFHGLHVIIGIIFLSVALFRARRGDFIKGGYLGFEFAAWYWHFVDVVWLFLFVFVYVLGR